MHSSAVSREQLGKHSPAVHCQVHVDADVAWVAPGYFPVTTCLDVPLDNPSHARVLVIGRQKAYSRQRTREAMGTWNRPGCTPPIAHPHDALDDLCEKYAAI